MQTRAVLLVFSGGVIGTALRATVQEHFPHGADQFPWATFVINVSGAFLLGLLIELLGRSRMTRESAQAWRLTLGTGLLGGFTTYSSFVVESVRLGQAGNLPLAVAYDAATLSLGFLVAFAAMWGCRRA